MTGLSPRQYSRVNTFRDYFRDMGKPRVKTPRSRPGSMGWAVFSERQRREWTQVELSAKAKIGQSQVSSIENDPSDRVRARTVLGVASAFACDPRALFEGKIEPVHEPGRIVLGQAAHRLELTLTADNLQRWIDFGQGLLAGQPKTEIAAVASARKGVRVKS